MNLVTTTMSSIEDEYIEWSHSSEKTKEIDCQMDSTDVKIIFIRGREIFPFINCPTPAVIENSINIASIDNEKIKNLFNEYLKKDKFFRRGGEIYVFPKDKWNKFEIRFFDNELLMREKFEEEEKKYLPYENARWCILV